MNVSSCLAYGVLDLRQDVYLGVSVSCRVVSLDKVEYWVWREDNLWSCCFFLQEENAVRVFDAAASIPRRHNGKPERREWWRRLGHDCN